MSLSTQNFSGIFFLTVKSQIPPWPLRPSIMWPWSPSPTPFPTNHSSPCSLHCNHTGLLVVFKHIKHILFSGPLYPLKPPPQTDFLQKIYKAPSLTIFQPLFQCQFLIRGFTLCILSKIAPSTTLYPLSLLYFSSQNLSAPDIIYVICLLTHWLFVPRNA